MTDLQASLTEILRRHCRETDPGASAGIIASGQLIAAESIGWSDCEDEVEASSGTNYRLASVSKQFTATAVLLLVREKRLRLSDFISDLLPGIPPGYAAVTVHHLLSHTSNLPDYEPLIDHRITAPIGDADVLAIIASAASPRSLADSPFHYSNTGYALLSLIVERVSGLPFADYLTERIFRPAGMRRSLAYEEGKSFVEQRAFGYSGDGKGAFVRTDQSVTSAVLGDGGIYSSVEDLARWECALRGNKLLDDQIKDSAWSVQAPIGESATGYGYGWYIGSFRGVPSLYHTGDSIGFRTYLERFPSRDLAVAVLMNRTEADVLGIGREIAAAALDARSARARGERRIW